MAKQQYYCYCLLHLFLYGLHKILCSREKNTSSDTLKDDTLFEESSSYGRAALPVPFITGLYRSYITLTKYIANTTINPSILRRSEDKSPLHIADDCSFRYEGE